MPFVNALLEAIKIFNLCKGMYSSLLINYNTLLSCLSSTVKWSLMGGLKQKKIRLLALKVVIFAAPFLGRHATLLVGEKRA